MSALHRQVHLGLEGNRLLLQLLGRLSVLDAVLVERGHASLRQADKGDGLLPGLDGHGSGGAHDDGLLRDADLVILVDVGVLLDGVAVNAAGLEDRGNLGLLGVVLGTLLLLRSRIVAMRLMSI